MGQSHSIICRGEVYSVKKFSVCVLPVKLYFFYFSWCTAFFQIRMYFLYSCTKKSDQAFILTNNSSDQALNQCALNWVKVSPFLSQIASDFYTKKCLLINGFWAVFMLVWSISGRLFLFYFNVSLKNWR